MQIQSCYLVNHSILLLSGYTDDNLKFINPMILNKLLGIADVGTESNLKARLVKASAGSP